ncbi:MAG: glycosyl hydrolase 108 family protein [Cyanobacteriota bacterium]|nr:glycosyl hydrolase 108 family protein [Cyanobacteriota bacterium]
MTVLNNNQNFEKALAFTQKWEGGFVDHPVDPGGRTNFGITQSTYNHWRNSKNLKPQDVKRIQPSEVESIYRDLYWIPAHCAQMVLPLAIAHFDTAVNFGVTGSVKFLQSVLKVKVDGLWGSVTQSAFEHSNCKHTAQHLVEARIRYRHQRIRENPSQQLFLQGWLNRDQALLTVVMR